MARFPPTKTCEWPGCLSRVGGQGEDFCTLHDGWVKISASDACQAWKEYLSAGGQWDDVWDVLLLAGEAVDKADGDLTRALDLANANVNARFGARWLRIARDVVHLLEHCGDNQSKQDV